MAEITPPDGYPFPKWVPEGGEDYFVPESLRADYAAIVADPIDWKNHGPRRPAEVVRGQTRITTTEPVPFEDWAHSHRLRLARVRVDQRNRTAAWEREHMRACPVCGEITDRDHWARVQTQLAEDQPLPPSTRGIRVCRRCAPVVENALRAGAVLPDGRTREAAAVSFVNTLTGRDRLRDDGSEVAA